MTHFKTALAALAAAFFLIFFTGCIGTKASGDLVTETFSEKDFHGLDIGVNGVTEVTVGPDFKVEITCEENIATLLDVRVENGILKIDFDEPVFDVDGLVVKVTAPVWDRFEVGGSGKIRVLDSISGSNLRLDVTGSGDILVKNAHFTKTDMDISGSGGIEMAGQGDDLDCEISGSGDVDCLGFLVKNATVEISGSGDMKLNVSEKLDAKISGSGSIEYLGNPAVSIKISGSGKVKKI